MNAEPWLARLNFTAAWLAAALALLGLALFVEGQVSSERHAGLWGLFLTLSMLPFTGAFWLSGLGWRRRWRMRGILQLAPVLVFTVWMVIGWW